MKDMNTDEIKKALDKVSANTKKGSKTFYRPLSKKDSELVREFYKIQMRDFYIPIGGNVGMKFKNGEGTLIAIGYNRVVIGDYGAYVEFTEDQIQLDNIKNRWPGKPYRPVKYLWMQTTDNTKTKVYFQQGTVAYADYKVGMYYVDPKDLIVDRDRPDFIC